MPWGDVIFIAANLINFNGAVAQLGEHLHGMQGVRGSIPLSSTKSDRVLLQGQDGRYLPSKN